MERINKYNYQKREILNLVKVNKEYYAYTMKKI